MSDTSTLIIKLNAGFTRIAKQFKSLAKVAYTGNYNDLTNKPNLSASGFSGSYNDLTDKPELSSVATSGSYTDLINTPEIATQAEAQTGTNNTALMTPLRVKEAIESLVSTPDAITFNTLSSWTEDPVEVFESFYNPTVTPDPETPSTPNEGDETTETVETQSIELPEVGITGI